MPSVPHLEAAFHVYFDEIRRCTAGGCYWALLHLVVVLPDICAALESSDGRTNGERYQGWCKDNLPGGPLSPDDRYEIRCILLHQGRTLARRGRYASYSFVAPNVAAGPVHEQVVTDAGGANMTLDVGAMANEMEKGVRRWFGELQKPESLARRQQVQQNLQPLVRVKPKVLPGIQWSFVVTSST